MSDLQVKHYFVNLAFQHLQLYLSFSLQSNLNTNDETIEKESENENEELPEEEGISKQKTSSQTR
jgi:hypothetical protein